MEGADVDGGPWAHNGGEERMQAQECVEQLGPWTVVENKEHQEVGGPTHGAGRQRPKAAKAYVRKKVAKIAGPWGAQVDEPDESSDEPDEFDRRIARERAGSVRERAWSAR